MPTTLTVEYAPGWLLDAYQPDAQGPSPVVLLWHGIGPAERDKLAPLATAAAELGVLVLVPDWRSDAPDRGKSHLLGSLAFARARAADFGGDLERFTLAGWSMGGISAASVAVNPDLAGGWRPQAVVCLGSNFRKAAVISGTPPLEDLATTAAQPRPFRLIHGTADPVAPVTASRDFAASLTQRGWPVRLEEPEDTDHGGVVQTEASGRLSARALAGLD